MRRSKNRGYGHEMDWEQRGEEGLCVLMLNSNIISVQNLDTDPTGGWRATCLAVTRSASTSKRLRS